MSGVGGWAVGAARVTQNVGWLYETEKIVTEERTADRIPNRIYEIIKARLQGMMALYEESSHVQHSATKGSLREKYLIDFFRELIPAKYAIEGGFICDLMGNNTLQLDFILADTSEIPLVALGTNVAYIPVEAALAAIEIKSTLRTSDLDQIEKQNHSLQELKIVNIPELGIDYSVHAQHNIPFFIFAYDTDVAEQTLDKWLTDIPNLLGICVVNNFYKLAFYRSDGKDVVLEKIETHRGDEFRETLVFIYSVFSAIKKASSQRGKIIPVLPLYIQALGKSSKLYKQK
jgi:hypothetical protein